jgi:alpha-ribazole phosphatase
MAALWLVRHARPLIEAGVCYGMTDVAADAEHTQHCAERLAAQLPQGLLLHSSPLSRCRQLADALGALRPDLARQPDDARLAEMDFGCWEQVRWDDIPRTAFDAWTQAFAQHRFGGRDSVAELMQRVGAAWRAHAAQAHGAVWITHAGVARAVTLWARGVGEVRRSEDWPRAGLAFGACSRVGDVADADGGVD